MQHSKICVPPKACRSEAERKSGSNVSLEEAQKDGDLDKIVCRNLRNKRKEELMSMDKPAVVQLCEKTGVDPLIKDIMVERIMMRENEGDEAIAMNDLEP